MWLCVGVFVSDNTQRLEDTASVLLPYLLRSYKEDELYIRRLDIQSKSFQCNQRNNVTNRSELVTSFPLPCSNKLFSSRG